MSPDDVIEESRLGMSGSDYLNRPAEATSQRSRAYLSGASERATSTSGTSFTRTATRLRSTNTKRSVIQIFAEKTRIPPWLIMIVAVSIPIIVLIIFASFSLATTNEHKKNAEWVERNVPLLGPVVGAIAMLQTERAAIGQLMVVDNTTSTWSVSLPQSMLGMTDGALTSARTSVDGMDAELRRSGPILKAMMSISEIASLRENLESQHSPFEAIDGYGPKILTFVSLLGTVKVYSPDDTTRSRIHGMEMISFINEYFHQVRAIGFALMRLNGTSFNNHSNEYVHLVEAVRQLQVAETIFLSGVDVDDVTLYTTIISQSVDYKTLIQETNMVINGMPLLKGNVTKWDVLTTSLTGKCWDLLGAWYNDMINDLHQSQDAAKQGVITITVIVVFSVLPAILVMYVTTRIFGDLREERAVSAEFEHMVQLTYPLVSLPNATEFRVVKGGVRRAVLGVILSVRITNADEICRGDGDENYFDMYNDMYTAMCNVAEQHEGSVVLNDSDRIAAILPNPDTALNAATQLQLAITHINVERSVTTQGRTQTPVQCNVVVHLGGVTLGAVGSERRVAAVATSGCIAFVSSLHRLAASLGVNLLATGSVMEEVVKENTVLHRVLGCVAQAHRVGAPKMAVYDVYALDDAPLRDLKSKLGDVLREVVYPIARVDVSRARAAVARALELEREHAARLASSNTDATLEMKAGIVNEKGLKDARCQRFDEK